MVSVGEIYRHFKGGEYEVKYIARGSDKDFSRCGGFVCECSAHDCDSPEEKRRVVRGFSEIGFWIEGVKEGEYVVYGQDYNSNDFPCGTIWFRSLEEFEGNKEFDDGGKVKRFELIGKD